MPSSRIPLQNIISNSFSNGFALCFGFSHFDHQPVSPIIRHLSKVGEGLLILTQNTWSQPSFLTATHDFSQGSVTYSDESSICPLPYHIQAYRHLILSTVTMVDSGKRVFPSHPESTTSFASLAPGYRWLVYHRDLNSQLLSWFYCTTLKPGL